MFYQINFTFSGNVTVFLHAVPDAGIATLTIFVEFECATIQARSKIPNESKFLIFCWFLLGGFGFTGGLSATGGLEEEVEELEEEAGENTCFQGNLFLLAKPEKSENLIGNDYPR